MRILVVEDEKRIADFLSRGLQGAGYAVDVAQDGSTALQFTHDTDYDLVILDIMLPDMDGLKVLERIRSRRAGPPVLILSARGAVDDRVRPTVAHPVCHQFPQVVKSPVGHHAPAVASGRDAGGQLRRHVRI